MSPCLVPPPHKMGLQGYSTKPSRLMVKMFSSRPSPHLLTPPLIPPSSHLAPLSFFFFRVCVAARLLQPIRGLFSNKHTAQSKQKQEMSSRFHIFSDLMCCDLGSDLQTPRENRCHLRQLLFAHTQVMGCVQQCRLYFGSINNSLSGISVPRSMMQSWAG